MRYPIKWGCFATLLTILAVHASFNQVSSQSPDSVALAESKSVHDFGAIGDGVADDSGAIQRAVDSQIGDIRFPRGKYRTTKTITVNLDSVGPTSFLATGPARIVMDGPGPAIRFMGTHAGTAAPNTVKDNVWENQRSPMVDGLEIVGAHPEACGIEADGTMQMTLTRVVVRKMLHAIHLVNRNRNVIISNCHLYENRGVGVYYDEVNLHQSNIIGCHISYNEQGGVVIRGGDVRNVHIGTCDIEGNMGGAGSKPTANILLDSTGGSIGEVAIVGCTIQHTHDAPNSANIRIDGESTERPFTNETRHGNITIADNVLSDVQVNIDVANTRGVTITGNTIWKGYKSNLQIDNSESIVVSGNVFDRNPRYLYGDGVTARLGLVFTDCQGCTINGNHIDQVGDAPAAMVVRVCSQFNITNCTILDCSPCGMLLENVSRSRVSDCLIDEQTKTEQPTISLRAVGGDGNMIVDNLLGCGKEISKGFTSPPDLVGIEIDSYFTPPVAWKDKTGGYRSPLRFADGRAVTTPEDWKRRRAQIAGQWERLLGKWPPLITEPNVEVLSTTTRENFSQHQIRFQWTPGEKTTGYLLIPNAPGPHPAVVVVYYEPETAIGLGKPNRDFALQLAKRGFVTLSIGTTEATKAKTFALYHPNIDDAKVQPLSMLAYAAANTWYVLSSREEVDADRIGIVGHSFGGKWAMFASCLFDNFACAAWSDPGIVFDESRADVNYWEPWYLGYHPKPWRKRGLITTDNPAHGLYPELVDAGHDLHELHALMAPRPFLVSGGSEDTPKRWEALNRSIEVNQVLGYKNRVAMSNRPNHAPNSESNEIIYKFFAEFLKP